MKDSRVTVKVKDARIKMNILKYSKRENMNK